MEAGKRERLDRALNPKTVVVVGAKKDADYSWLRHNKALNGKLYSVQLDPNELPGIAELGVPNFTSLMEVPDPVDYVICAVPRNVAPRIVQDCITKGVGAVTLYTSGFAETGSEEGIRLQNLVTDMAKAADLNLVGPNCMGIYNPKVGLKFNSEQSHANVGPVAFISQSGSQGGGFSMEAQNNAIGISKVVSFGNGVVLDNTDYLEYFADDPETQIIAMYMEGTRDGRRFFKTLRDVASRKPVVIWKGGVTAESAKAASSHTGSLAIPSEIWNAMLKQCGAVNVHGMAETIDAVKALLYSTPISKSPRLGLIAASGGHSVEISDAFSREGHTVPRLSEESYQELESFYSVVGGSFRNPLEGGGNWRREETAVQVLNILERDPNVDAVVVEMGAGGLGRSDPETIIRRVETLARSREGMRKPLWAVLGGDALRGDAERMREAALKLQENGIPTFQNFVRAARALRNLVDYYANRQ